MHLYMWISNRWLNQRMCVCGSGTTVLTGLVILFGYGVNGGTACFALLYSLAFTEVPQELYEGDIDVGSSPQSIVKHMEADKSVHLLVCNENSHTEQMLSSWPSKGRIAFENICLSHKTNPNVLRDVSFEVVENRKVGVVGRTGAGKSSLLTALFRYYWFLLMLLMLNG